MNTRKVIILLCLLGLLVSTVAHTKITFSSRRDGIEGVYVMDDDGGNQTLLIEGDHKLPYPNCWSPDGKQIVFKGKFYCLYLMNADGTNVRQLTEPGVYVNRASFSPDGQSLVFKRRIEKPGAWKDGTVVLNIETGEMEEISDFWGNQHDWAPDGKHIICAEPSTHGVHNTIYIMDADGDNLRELIPVAPNDGEWTIHRQKPRWSPDGKQIVFLQKEWKTVTGPNGRETGFFKAFRYMICNRNGGNLRSLPIIPKDMEGLAVDWMDDGDSIVFSARTEFPLNQPLPDDFDWFTGNIYKYHIKTRVITRLTNHPGHDESLDWISDDVLSVSPKDKKKVTWGTLKQSDSK